MVIRCLHGVHPKVVGHLQVLTYLTAGHAQRVNLVLIAIKLEHVAHKNRALPDLGVELQGRIERNVSSGMCQLEVVDVVYKSSSAKKSIA